MFKKYFYRIVAAVVGVTCLIPGFGTVPSDTTTEIEPVRNVIMLIGDGMGMNVIKKAEQETGVDLSVFDEFTLVGESRTRALGGITTDSAAGGTALATGVKTSKNCLGVYASDIDVKKAYPMNLCELAIEMGKSTGILTTGKAYDATPGAFSAHQGFREDYEEIQKQQAACGVDLIWGYWNHDKIGDTVKGIAKANGKQFLMNKSDLDSYTGEVRSLGAFGSSDLWRLDPQSGINLSYMMQKALPILSRNENGFFLMAESDHIDSNVEDRDDAAACEAVLEFARTVKLALNYAKSHRDTMVIVTADHETGFITKIAGEYRILSSLHSGRNVPVFVYGCDNFMTPGERMENTEVGRRIANAMGETNFPRKIAK